MRESDKTLQQTTTHREHFAQHTHKRTRVKQKRDFARPHTDKKLHNSNQQLSEKRMFTFRFHLRQRTVPVLLPLPCASVRLPEQPAGASSGLPREPAERGCCLDQLHAAQIVKICAFVLCSFQSPKCLGLLVFSGCLTLGRFVQFYILEVHGLQL